MTEILVKAFRSGSGYRHSSRPSARGVRVGAFVWVQHPDECPGGRWDYHADWQDGRPAWPQPTYDWVVANTPRVEKRREK